jgi:hypothetical protein
MKTKTHTKPHVETLTSEERVRRAMKVLMAPEGLVADKMQFLKLKGCSDAEVMEALNQATGGELVRTALGGAA